MHFESSQKNGPASSAPLGQMGHVFFLNEAVIFLLSRGGDGDDSEAQKWGLRLPPAPGLEAESIIGPVTEDLSQV